MSQRKQFKFLDRLRVRWVCQGHEIACNASPCRLRERPEVMPPALRVAERREDTDIGRQAVVRETRHRVDQVENRRPVHVLEERMDAVNEVEPGLP